MAFIQNKEKRRTVVRLLENFITNLEEENIIQTKMWNSAKSSYIEDGKGRDLFKIVERILSIGL